MSIVLGHSSAFLKHSKGLWVRIPPEEDLAYFLGSDLLKRIVSVVSGSYSCHSFTYFYLSCTVQLIKHVHVQSSRCDSNHRPLVLEATTLPTEQPPALPQSIFLENIFKFKSAKFF